MDSQPVIRFHTDMQLNEPYNLKIKAVTRKTLCYLVLTSGQSFTAVEMNLPERNLKHVDIGKLLFAGLSIIALTYMSIN